MEDENNDEMEYNDNEKKLMNMLDDIELSSESNPLEIKNFDYTTINFPIVVSCQLIDKLLINAKIKGDEPPFGMYC